LESSQLYRLKCVLLHHNHLPAQLKQCTNNVFTQQCNVKHWQNKSSVTKPKHGYSIHLIVDNLGSIPRLSRARLHKIGIHNFHARRSALKSDSVKISRQVRSLCIFGLGTLKWEFLGLWMVRLVVTNGSLTRRPQRSLQVCLLLRQLGK